MKKVIIYGVRNVEVRRNIEFFLSDDYEIIGYSDGHYPYDVIDEKTFFRPEELCEQEFDFIVPTAQSSSTQTEIRRLLTSLGVPPEKIIRPFAVMPGDLTKTHPDIIANIERTYQGEPNLIFGSSYSYNGILEKELDAPFFNCSCAGLDFYYDLAIFRYMEDHGLLPKLGTVILSLAYYCFDADLTMFPGHYQQGFMCSLWRLNDWHNCHKVSIAPEYIESYHMFAEKLTKFYHVPLWKLTNHRVCHNQKGTYMLDPVWFTEHEETEKENRRLFVEFYQKMESGGGRPIVIVPPFYLEPFNKPSREALQRKKERFYKIFRELEAEVGPIKIYDYLEAIPGPREWYRDVTHLNTLGAAEFTKLINRDILSREALISSD